MKRFVALALLTACSKGGGTAGPSGAVSSTPAPSASVAAAPSPKPAIAASGWSGSYTAKVGPVTPPEAAHEKQWTQDNGHEAVGAGTIELSVSSSGSAIGEARGALGELGVSGTFDGHELRANLIPKDPNSEGAMTGYMALIADGDPSAAKELKGSLRVASRDAKLVREANVDLTRK